jgi:predicted anti-sigma-YlaC factor YlaD
MHCRHADELMSERLDGRLTGTEAAFLEEHLQACDPCRTEWDAMRQVDALLNAAPLIPAPPYLHQQVMARIRRREEARRVLLGGLALTLGAVTLMSLMLAPLMLSLLDASGLAPALWRGGPETMVQLITFLGATGRALWVVLRTFAVPLAALGFLSLLLTLALNGLWIGALYRLRVSR